MQTAACYSNFRPGGARRRRRGLGAVPRSIMLRLSEAGARFLKATIASRDFPGIMPQGVPDRFGGNTFVVNHQVTSAFTGSSSGEYIAVMPIPNAAVWSTASPPSKTQPWGPVKFPNADQIFPGGAATGAAFNITQFRVLGGSVEIQPTSAPTLTSGVIILARVPVTVQPTTKGATVTSEYDIVPPGTAGATQWQESNVWLMASDDTTKTIFLQTMTVDGLSSIQESYITAGSYYYGPACNGVYAPLVATNPSFEFCPAFHGVARLPMDMGDAVGGVLNGDVLGFDCGMGSVGIVILNSDANSKFRISVNLLVEYKPDPGSILSQMATPSAVHDPLAMSLYEQFAKEMPVAVPAYENSGFWSRFLEIVDTLSGALSVVPGPIGAAATLVGAGARLLR